MNFKTISLIAAVLLQPVLGASTISTASAAAVGGGGGGGGGGEHGGAGNLNSIMDNGVCGRWDFKKAEKAMEVQKPLCSTNQAPVPFSFAIASR